MSMKKLSESHKRELDEIFTEYSQNLPPGDQHILGEHFYPILETYQKIKGTLFGISESDDNILLKIVKERCFGMSEKRTKKIFNILTKTFKFIEPRLFEKVKGRKLGHLRNDILVPGSNCHYRNFFLLKRISEKPGNNTIRQTSYDPLSASKVISPNNLDKMEPMGIIELIPGTIHSNKVIFATQIDPGFKMTAYHLIIEDETGQCAKLCIYNITHELELLFTKSGVNMAIVNPYYKSSDEDGCNYIRVETPEEIFIIPELGTEQSSEISSEDYKNKGNNFYNSEKYFEAIACYSRAINGDPCNPFYRSNRAQCFIKTGEYEEALCDAEKAVDLDPSSLKFNYRLAMAWSGLGNHEKSVAILETLQTDDAAITPALESERTLLANTRGEIDLIELARKAKNGEVLKIGDYIGPVTIGTSPKHGHAMFATKDIKRGELISVTKAIAFVAKAKVEDLKILHESTPYGKSSKMNNAILLQKMTDNIIKSKLTAFRVFNLYNKRLHHEPIPIEYYRSQGYELIRGKGKPPYQMDQLRDIVQVNTFSYNHNEIEEDKYIMPSGIWPLLSHINHSCTGNAWPKAYRDLLIIRACTFIPKGAEVTTSFFDTYACVTLEDRITKLSYQWGFKCICDLCKFESDPRNKNVIQRAILLCNRVHKQVATESNPSCILQHNHFKLLNQALDLAEEMKLGPTRFNSAVWQVIITLTRLMNFPKDRKKLFRIYTRVKQFLCEKDLKHQWFFWMNCLKFANLELSDDVEFKSYAEQMFNEVESYLIDIP